MKNKKEKKTNYYLEHCLYFTSNKMNRIINKLTEEAFLPTGLAPSYAFLMMVVIDEESIGIGELSEILSLAPSTVSRAVDKLMLKGYLDRTQSGRNITVYITEKGKELDPVIKESWKNLYLSYCKILGEDVAVKLTSDMVSANDVFEDF